LLNLRQIVEFTGKNNSLLIFFFLKA